MPRCRRRILRKLCPPLPSASLPCRRQGKLLSALCVLIFHAAILLYRKRVDDGRKRNPVVGNRRKLETERDEFPLFACREVKNEVRSNRRRRLSCVGTTASSPKWKSRRAKNLSRKNTGRLAELLVPGRKVHRNFPKPRRKTDILIAVEHDDPRQHRLSSAQRRRRGVVRAGRSGIHWENLRREVTYGIPASISFSRKSTPREQDSYVEVKGVTLVKRNIALFPDARLCAASNT